MREPRYGVPFPLSEYQERHERIRKAMQDTGTDVLILARQENLEYVSGFLHASWQPGFRDFTQQVVLFADPAKEAVLIAPCDLTGCFQTSAISDIRAVNDLTTHGNYRELFAVFTEYGIRGGKIGVEDPPDGRTALPAGVLDRLKSAFSAASFTDCSDLMDRIRMIKSPMEILFVREACAITTEAVEAGIRAIRPGVTEAEIANTIASEMVRLSKQCYTTTPWFIYVYADGKCPVAWDGVASQYAFREGDCVYIDAGIRKYGYYSDMIRVASLGEPSPEKRKIYDASREANHELISYMRPGLRAGDVYQHLYDTYRELGYQKEIDAALKGGFVCEGHGIGLSVHEPPYIVPDCEIVLESGMTMSVEPNLFLGFPFPETRVALKPENNILITETGCEVLSKSPDHLRIVE